MRAVSMLMALTLVWVGQLPGQSRRLIGTLREDLKVQEKKYAEAQMREQRLLEMRIRHDLGLPIRAGRYLEMSEDEARLIRFAEPGMLSKEEQATRQLALQLARLQDQLESRAEGTPLQGFEPIALPSRLTTSQPSRIELPEPDRIAVAEQPPARPWGEVRPLSLANGIGSSSEAPAIIKGSRDVANIGRVLLRSGEVMLSRSKSLVADGDSEEAARWLERAHEELQRARKELDPLVWQQSKGKLGKTLRSEARLPDMFLLAQCEEKLGNHGVAEELYLQIQGLDHSLDQEGVSQPGQWGLAAEAANRVMIFMIDHGNWAPVPSISSLQWQNK